MYISTMNTSLKKLIYFTLIAFYSISATVGNIVVLRELLNSGDNQHQLTSEKKSRSIPDSPVWTIKTHLPPTVDSDLSIHIVPSNEVSSITKPATIFVNVEIALVYSSLEFLPSKPRDPPLA